jgi:hypothetical protein
MTGGIPSSSLARVVAEGGHCTTATPPGHHEVTACPLGAGRCMREEMAAASFTAAKSLAPLATRSGALLLGSLLRRARREQAHLRRWDTTPLHSPSPP